MASALLEWFDGRERDVPWRHERDPYRILVAEVMAQQTRIETVAAYYARFIERFPTAASLAEAELDEVLKLWQGLGYYARARHLHAAAGQVVQRHAGMIPETVEELRGLAGIGPYTAGAVASFAFGTAEPAVDGNARRVLSRLFDIADPTPARLDASARALVNATDRPGGLNQAIMDLGSSICTPRTPDCGQCPVRTGCRARLAGTVGERPPRKTRAPTRLRVAAAAIVRRDDRILLVRRPDRGLLGGLWDFPGTTPNPVRASGRGKGGGSVQGPTPRELSDGIEADHGVRIAVEDQAARVLHTFSHFRLDLEIRNARWIAGEPSSGAPFAWAAPGELDGFAVPTYLRSVLPALVTGDS